MRLSEALARLYCSAKILPKHVREARRLLSESIIAVEARDVTLEEDDDEIDEDADKGPILPSTMRASIAKEERKMENEREEVRRRSDAGLPAETNREREDREKRAYFWNTFHVFLKEDLILYFAVLGQFFFQLSPDVFFQFQ